MKPAAKKVLIITYYWPPSGGSGVQRWLKFSKYLPQFGWQPVIYTPENPDFAIKDKTLLKDIPEDAIELKRPIWEPYAIYRTLTGNRDSKANFGGSTSNEGGSLLHKLAGWIRGNFFIPDPRVFWKTPSLKFLSKYLTENPVDVIVTTGPPHSMHLIGLGLKKRFPDLPWLADMRDPWSTFDLHNSFMNKRSKRKNARFEREVLEYADRVIMVSPSSHEEFQDFDLSKEVLITNGFDPEDFKNMQPDNTGKFSIYHSGLLNYIRNPENLWQVLDKICRENSAFKKDFELELIGAVDPLIMKAIHHYPFLKEKVRERGWLQHDEIIRENNKAAVLMLVVNNSRNAKAQLPGKFFEYLALQKPILGICPDNADIAKAIDETNTGFTCDFEETSRLETLILNLYKKWKHKESLDVNEKAIAAYERKNLTGKLVDVMEDCLFGPPIANSK